MTKRGWTSTGIVLTALCLHGQSPTPAQEPILPLVNARPDDRVTLFDGARLLTTVAAPTGAASLSGLPKLTPGTHDIRAHIRGGDAPQAAARVTIPNAGGRAFQRQTSVLAGRGPKALAKADFDGDGWIDVVVLDSASALHLLRGDRGGSFQKTQRICEEDAVEAIASGDLNGDGLADLVLTGPKGTRVLAGDGRGGVLSKPLAQLQESGVAILIADWTGDGIADLMLLHPDKDRASFLAGIAQGGFTPRGELRFADRVSAMTAADFDLDGITDLAVARGESHLVTIFRGRGDLQFERGGDFAAGGIPIALDTTAGDEQGPHLVVRLAGSTEAVLLAAKGGATFYPPSAVPGLWADSADALEADLNGDGAPDRVTASQNAALDVGIRAAGNYTISKTHSGSFYRGMKGARYTILVTGDPEAPMVTDILPPGLILKDAQGPGWECIINPGNDLTCFGYARDQNGNLPPLTVFVDVAPNAPNVITNTATVTGGATASDTVTLITGGPGGIDLAIAKSHPGNFPPGAIGRQYTLLVTNVGVTATNGGLVGVLDTLPSALTATAIAGPGWACTLAPLGCTRSGALAPGASFPPIVITVNVAANAPYGDVNLAEVGGGGDANPFNNVAEDFTAFAADAPDLSIVKSHAGIFTQGQIGALYSIVVTNVGSAGSTGLVTVYETLPAGLTATGISGAGWNCNLTSLVCTRSDALAIGASFPAITVTVNVDSNAPSSVINIAGVSSGGDQNPANDQWDDTTLIQPPSSADLTITKSHVGNFRQGQLRAHYTIGVTNVGGAEPTGTVTITENPPAGMTIVEMGALVGWNCNGNSCTASPTNYSVPLNVYVNVSPTAAANLTNTATVSTAGDSNLTNNTASDPTIIDPASPDLTITKSHTGDFARGQQGVTYTLTVTNVGDAPSYGTITVTENPPAGLTITGMSGQNWSCDITTRTCTNLQQFIIPPGGGVATNQPITVTADVAINAPADFINQATVSGGGDSTPGNNTASDPTHTTGPDLRITKTHRNNFYQGQLRASYELHVTNVGESEPTGNVTITENPPAGMTIVEMGSFVGWSCNTSTRTCTAPPATYTTPLTVTVNVSPTAAANLTNTATVSTAGDSNLTNNTASDPTIITPASPDLTITKSHVGNFARGQQGVQYTLLVSNVGDAPSYGSYTVTENPPTGLTITAISGGQNWTCDLASRSCTPVQQGIIPPGGSAQPITVTADVASNAPADFINQATVSGGGDSTPGNNTASDPTHTTGPDLRLTKTHRNDFYQGQLRASYELRVTNVGESEPTGNVTITENPPAGMTIVEMGSFVGWSCNTSTRTCTAPPATYTTPLTVTVNVSPTAAANLTNTATVSTAGDSNLTNNTASDPTIITPASPDLTITKSHVGNFARGQQGVTYTLLVSNVGDAPSYGSYTVTENPPTGLTITAISGGQNWTCDLGSRSCTPVQQGIIPPGGSAQPITVTADIAINAPADFINQATVSGGGDSTPGNNTASDPTHTTGPDLRITKTHRNDFYQGQLRASYELRVTNVGESEPTGNVTITENPPAGMTIVEMGSFVGWSCNGNSCTAPPATYTTPLTVTVNVSPTAAANLTNTATVSTAGDSNLTNNTASDPTVVTPASPDLTITKSHVGNFARGQQGVQYTLLVSNVGDAPSYGSYTVTENPPTGLTITAISGGQNWTCDLASRSCTPVQQGIIPPGGSAQPITVTADVASNAPADFINQATVSGGGDSTPGNNTASDPTHTTGPDLRLTKTHRNDFYQGQLRASYELHVTNVGESEPTGNVTITENPPAGMTIVEMGSFVGWSCNTSTRTCTAPPATYTTPLTVTVNVSPTAAANLTNTATVSTAGDSNLSNNTASDPTIITPASPDLTIAKSHVGNFARGQQGVQYTLLVSNVGDAPSYGSYTVTENPPTGLTITAISGGQNWTCDLASRSCTPVQQGIIPPGGSAQPITVTADVAINAPADFINQATVSGGGDSTPGNNTASDPTHTTGPDLRLTKTHRNDFYQGQLRASYELRVTNVGESEPTGNITITENPPAGMTIVEMGSFVGWSCNGNSCTTSPTSYTTPLTVTVNVSPTAAANLTNTATVSTAGDTNLTNNTASDPTVIAPASPDLTITKSHVGNFARGQQGVTYTLLVSNVGDAPSYGSYTVTDNPPTGLTVTAISGGQNWTCDLASRSCTPVQQGIIPPGGSAQPITVTADVAINAPADFINQATVSGGGDSTPGNNTASDPTHTTGPDLRITKTHRNDFYQGQLRAGYELRVTNVGESEPTGNITITENPPAGMTIVEMGSFVGWSCNTGTRTCTAPPATYTTPLTVTVNVSPTAAANLTNTATVSTAGDTNHTNNTASDPTVITPASPDLTITKSHVGNFARGQQGVQYTLLVSNVGDAPSYGSYTVTDNPPAGLTITAISGGQNWTCDLASRSCTPVQQGIIPPGGSAQPITVTANVGPLAPANLINRATVSGGGDSTPGNNTASDPATVIIPPVPDLTVNKTHNGTFTQGQIAALYTISVTNSGTGPTVGMVTAADVLPLGLTLTSISGSGWACTPAPANCTRSDSLAAGATYPPISVRVNVGPNAPPQLTNTAVVTGGGETNLGNNSVDDLTAIAQTALNVTMTQSAIVFNRATGLFRQTVTVTNLGAPTAALALALDTLPPGVTLVGPSGFTAVTAPAGSPYVEMGPVGTGASVSQMLEFSRLGPVAITYTPRILGAGPR